MNPLRRFLTAICLLGLLAPAGMTGAATPTGLVYSGRTHWDAATGSLTFETDGTMPDTKEGFYNISGYANHSVLHVSRCRLVDTRPGDNNNSDGFAGAAGSTLTDTFISTSDDAIKVYRDMTVRNVTIEQRRNGAPIQLGWGGEPGPAKVTIENLTIRGVDPQGLYNMAPSPGKMVTPAPAKYWCAA